MTDKMPATGQVCDFAALRFPLLHAVFAEMNYPRVESIANVAGGTSFRKADQRNSVFAPADCFRLARNAFGYAERLFLNDVATDHEFLIVARPWNMPSL